MPKRTTIAPPEPAAVLRAALYYAGRGCSVFPVNTKSRASYYSEETTGRRWGASKDAAIVRQMFQEHPRAGVAIETGAVSGLFVLEIDNKNGKNGAAALEALQDQHRSLLPWTATARSPSGGMHWYFEHPGRSVRTSVCKLGAGIDVLGDNFNVIAPPSLGRSWITSFGAMAPAPAWLVNLVCEERHPPRRSLIEPQKQKALPPDMLALLKRDAGRGLSTAPEDMLTPDDVDLKIWCALRVVPADLDYLDWFRVGCAIYAALGDAGLDHFDEWSREAPHKYPGERAVEHKWSECRKARSIGPETLYYLADQQDRSWRDAYRVMLQRESVR